MCDDHYHHHHHRHGHHHDHHHGGHHHHFGHHHGHHHHGGHHHHHQPVVTVTRSCAPPAITPQSLRPALKEGFLTKQGEIFKTWKRRWFVLKGKSLYYFVSTSVSTSRLIIRLKLNFLSFFLFFVELCATVFHPSNLRYVYSIFFKEKCWSLVSDNQIIQLRSCAIRPLFHTTATAVLYLLLTFLLGVTSSKRTINSPTTNGYKLYKTPSPRPSKRLVQQQFTCKDLFRKDPPPLMSFLRHNRANNMCLLPRDNSTSHRNQPSAIRKEDNHNSSLKEDSHNLPLSTHKDNHNSSRKEDSHILRAVANHKPTSWPLPHHPNPKATKKSHTIT